MRAAVYCGTRNLYEDMLPAVKSLLRHTEGVHIYLMIEDDVFPYELPECVTPVNVSGQTWFHHDGPNYINPWTWMPLMRAALTKVFPDLDMILSLDADTIVERDISELWDIPLDGYYAAGVTEPKKEGFRQPYINFGVVLLNLKKLREDGMDDRIIHSLNTEYTFANEQDVYNRLCREQILTLPSIYNANDYTEPCTDPKIIHFAGIGESFPWSGKRWQDAPIIQKYRDLPWREI